MPHRPVTRRPASPVGPAPPPASSRRAAPSPLDAHLGFWLRYVSNHVSGQFAQRIQASGVSISEWVALRLLFDLDEATPAALIEALGMTKGAVSKIVDRLTGKGLSSRRPDPQDARAQRIVLEPAGRALVHRLARLADDNDAACFACLTATEQAALIRTMKKLVAHHRLAAVPVD